MLAGAPARMNIRVSPNCYSASVAKSGKPVSPISRTVPTLVPKSGLFTVDQDHLSGCKSDALHARGLSKVMLDR